MNLRDLSALRTEGRICMEEWYYEKESVSGEETRKIAAVVMCNAALGMQKENVHFPDSESVRTHGRNESDGQEGQDKKADKRQDKAQTPGQGRKPPRELTTVMTM